MKPPPKLCFTCTAADGRMVRLMRERYDSHILDEHPDLARDFAYPISEIQKALELAETHRPGSGPKTHEYIGPVVIPNAVTAGFHGAPKPRRMHVIVFKEADNHGHVVTAYTTTL